MRLKGIAMVECEAPFSISRIRITGFKSIRKAFELDFNDGATILVGDNGVGKTTIIEATHLALCGRYREVPIARCISEYLFNKDAVDDFIDDQHSGNVPFPEICVDVYLAGGDKASQAKFSGSYCLEKTKHCGFSFKIEFDNDYLDELKNIEIESLPVEYYVASWVSFAGEKLTPRSLPVTSLLLNPNGDMRPSYGTDRATRSLLDILEKREHIALSQSARKGKTCFRDAVRNGDTVSKLKGCTAFKAGEIELDVNIGSADSWYRDLTVALFGVPYENIGAGPQCLLQSEISFGCVGSGSRPAIVLIEEPENHLSYGNLNKLLSLFDDNGSQQFFCTTHSSFVANKLGLQNLVIVGKVTDGIDLTSLVGLPKETYKFFRKLPGFETLRLALVDKAILVEGPSDELIIQRAYHDKYDKPPLSNGVDVISVGLAYDRFLQIAKRIGKKVAVVTDNDGHPEKVKAKFENYSDCDNIQCFYDSEVHTEAHEDYPELRLNTLEATLVRSAGREAICEILESSHSDDFGLMQYMEANKTNVALKIFESSECIGYPDYIMNAIEWIELQ